jgi:cation diffusion facilitator CzcD-associated flavoprotein CzcO
MISCLWLLQVESMVVKHMHKAIKDPQLQKQLTPSYTIGCKRILGSDDYYPSLAAPNVKLVPAGLRQVSAACWWAGWC